MTDYCWIKQPIVDKTLSVSIGVLQMSILAFSTRFGWYIPGFFSSKNPKKKVSVKFYKYESVFGIIYQKVNWNIKCRLSSTDTNTNLALRKSRPTCIIQLAKSAQCVLRARFRNVIRSLFEMDMSHFKMIPKEHHQINEPSSRYESFILPPSFLIIWIASKFPDPFKRNTAFTANSANCFLCCAIIFDPSVVDAIFIRSDASSSLKSVKSL